MAANTSDLLKKLFQWKTEVEVNGVQFYLRVVGDQVIDEARKRALLASRRLRRDLRNEDSDSYLMYLDIVEEMSEEELRNAIVVMEAREVMREYMQQNPRPPLPELPDYPSQEQQEEYEAAKDEREDAYIEEMKSYVDKWREDLESKLKKAKREQLEARWKKNATDKVCEDEFTSIFEDYIVSQGTYVDEGFQERAFSFEDYRALPSEIKGQLREAYNNITLNSDEIKK